MNWIFFDITMLLFLSREFILKKSRRKKNFIAFTILLIIIFGFRYKLGYDYDTYNEFYKNIPKGWHKNLEIGFRMLIILLNKVFSDSRIMYFLITLFKILILSKMILKISKFPVLTLLFYVYIPLLLDVNNSTLRQSIAEIFFILAVEAFIKKRKYYICILYIIMGSLFHKSILLISLLITISNLKLNIKKLFGVFVFIVGINLTFNKFWMFIPYGRYLRFESGIRILSSPYIVCIIGINAILMFYLFKSRERINYNKDRTNRIILNISVYSFLGILGFFNLGLNIIRIFYYPFLFYVFSIGMFTEVKKIRNMIVLILIFNILLANYPKFKELSFNKNSLKNRYLILKWKGL